jgi:ATP-dependent DNA helicase RecQ
LDNTSDISLDPQALLLKHWGYDDFRPHQKGPVRDFCAGKDVLAILPTGGGKTICFQIPGIYHGGLCLVVSPLIALMKDQVETLRSKGIRCDAITAESHPNDADRILENAALGALQFLYVSPERIQSELFLARIERMPVATIAIDEAHCISQWGHDFRPAYRELVQLRALKPKAIWGAFTATATPEVLQDIAVQLQLKTPAIHRSSMRRPNLHYGVCGLGDAEVNLIQSVKKTEGTGLVYVGTRIGAERWADRLKESGISAMAYHAGLDSKEKARRQKAWLGGDLRVMVCTSAFGMGIDKPDVRWVYHAYLPSDLESYVQEAGRAGRDGQVSSCILFCDDEQLRLAESRLSSRFPSMEEITEVYQAIANSGPVALGDQPENPTTFEPDLWGENSGRKRSTIDACGSLLEQAGLIKIHQRVNHPGGSWTLLATSSQNQEWIVSRRWGWELLDALRRHPNAREGIQFNPEKWAKKMHLPVQSIMDWLARWDRMGIGEWKVKRQGWWVEWKQPRCQNSRLTIPQSIYGERKEVVAAKWEHVRAYLNQTQCRSTFLEGYFGQSGMKCGQCDLCREAAWDAETWVRNQIPEDGIDGFELIQRIPVLLHDAGLRTLQQMRRDSEIYTLGNQVFLST